MLQKELGYEFQNILYNDLCGKLTVCYLYVLDGTATPLQATPIQCSGMCCCVYMSYMCTL